MKNNLEKISEVFLCHTGIALPDGEHFTPIVYIPINANNDTEILIEESTVANLSDYEIHLERFDFDTDVRFSVYVNHLMFVCKKKDLNKVIEKFRELIEKGLKNE